MEKKILKKAKITITIFLISLVIFSFIFTLFYFKERKEINDIERIEINVNYGHLSSTYIYEIDFTNNSVTHTSVAFNSNNSESFVTNFSEEDVEYFIKYANLYGFFNWKESYTYDGYVQDGPQTIITIEYTNGSTQTTDCYAEFPNTYDEMQEVFIKAFGYDML